MTFLPPLDESLVARLVAEQFPQWTGLPIVRIPSPGTDNEIFRLGGAMSVRLPKVDWAVGQAEKEDRWLPELAARVPLDIPKPVAVGEPGYGYPWRWAVQTWLDGETATPDRLTDQRQAARRLAGFIVALRAVDATGGPRSGRHNHFRGVVLTALDARVRESLDALDGKIPTGHVAAAWRNALSAPTSGEGSAWLHGDLHAANLLVIDGELTGVIDFGLMGVGDPATDLMVAWSMFDDLARAEFREVAEADDEIWARGRGWALYSSLIALQFYWEKNPQVVAGCLRTINAVLEAGAST